jgi:predicted nucleotidyltransferase
MASLDDIDSAVQTEIGRRLREIENSEGVRYLLVVESGSRAWGFPSPDSDFDVRFIYARPIKWYLSLRPGRDVIEQPIEDEIDLNGWDIRKALSLLLKSNSVVSEWLGSPIRYRDDDPAVAGLRQLADFSFNPKGMALHYASLGGHPASKLREAGDAFPVKRYFYALRPALAIRALRVDPKRRPPMNLQELAAVADLGAEVVEQIDELVLAKSRTNERENVLRLPELDRLIFSELELAATVADRPLDSDVVERFNDYFRSIVDS